ncbi:YraN family protein [Thalassococcus sp. CAU 1522]|uniref:UPF0102 protein KUH32_09260 n=1 Tax=Thalassococcus arenae TaxID=2851652 RepID=A0ABS6N7G8_9RHOB|nr:YraN family protein [Thalassococcus arenae]MBV2359962.1 YraN family protein [Thalassococcus arenae]
MQLAFDFSQPVAAASGRAVADDRRARGRRGYHAGLSAEECVARDYQRRGYRVARQRWRGKGGELDLVLEDGDGLVFVEVKASRDFDRAVARVTPRQQARLCRAAEEFLGGMPRGSLTPVRFDVALVDGRGAIRVIENALAP